MFVCWPAKIRYAPKCLMVEHADTIEAMLRSNESRGKAKRRIRQKRACLMWRSPLGGAQAHVKTQTRHPNSYINLL